MTTIEYDLDLTGGLMEEIQRLVSPPESQETQKKRKIRERVHQRRPGKPPNRDCCDSCGEGGDLVCCDRCPASFHMQCHDPPLEEEDVPPGEWLCHRCRTKPMIVVQEEDDAASTCSSKSRQSESSGPTVSRKRPRRPSRDEEVMELVFDEDNEEKHPLQILARAASIMNPRQFELPKEMACPLQLPGSSKRKPCKESGRGGTKKGAHELDNGMVPLPAKLCYICGRSCRIASLLQCDYCPLVFHLDCLDPPLTYMPTTRWMCPNHSEYLTDEKLLKSLKLTERVKLWDKFTAPVGQHSVKIEFLKKIHRTNPPFRIKVRHKRKQTTKVPNAIKSQYAFPPPILPKPRTRPDYVLLSDEDANKSPSAEDRSQWLANVIRLQADIAKYLEEDNSKRDEKYDVVTKVSTSVTTTVTSSLTKPTASVTPVLKQDVSSSLSSHSCSTSSLSSSASDSALKEDQELNSRFVLNGPYSCRQEIIPNGPLSSSSKSGHISLLTSTSIHNGTTTLLNDTVCSKTDSQHQDDVQQACIPPQNIVRISVAPTSLIQRKNIVLGCANKGNMAAISKLVSSDQTGKLSDCEDSIPLPLSSCLSEGSPSYSPHGKLSPTTVAASSGAKIFTMPPYSQAKGSIAAGVQNGQGPVVHTLPAICNSNSSSALCNLSPSAELGDINNIDLNKLDQRLIQTLALQRLKQLQCQQQVTIETLSSDVNEEFPPVHKERNDLRVRALVCPLTGKGQPVPMPYRTLNIGTGADMSVSLTDFGHCNYVSPKHACIFYDEASRQYELLNYSEHGTTVDNVLYSCDFSEKSTNFSKATGVIGKVRKIIKKARVKKQQEEEAYKTAMSKHAFKVLKGCSCRTSSSSLIGGSGAGWEGTALLHHGSYIKVGCLQFVFSIVEQATQEPLFEQKPEILSNLNTDCSLPPGL